MANEERLGVFYNPVITDLQFHYQYIPFTVSVLSIFRHCIGLSPASTIGFRYILALSESGS